MTEEEKDKKILQDIIKDIEELLTTKYKNISVGWYMMIGRPNADAFFGNRCPVCCANRLMEWIEENDIDHMDNETIQ